MRRSTLSVAAALTRYFAGVCAGRRRVSASPASSSGLDFGAARSPPPARPPAPTPPPPLPRYALGLAAASAQLTVTGPGQITNATPETLIDGAAAGLEAATALGAVAAAGGDGLLAAARDGAALAKMRRETGAAFSCVDGVPFIVGGRFAVAGAAAPCSLPGGGHHTAHHHPLFPAADAAAVAAARAAGLLVVAQAPWDPGAPGAAGTAAVPSADAATARAAKASAAAAGGRAPWVAPAAGDDGAPRAACLPGAAAACALAAGAAPVALTADAAGSARLSAAWTGTVAFLPTPGRLARAGLASVLGARLDAPALAARSALDAALLLGFLQRPGTAPGLRPCPGVSALARLASDRPGDLMDAVASSPARLVRVLLTGEPGAAGRAAVAAAGAAPPLAGLRVAVPEVHADLLTPPAQAALKAASDALTAAGANVFPVPGPRFFHPAAASAIYTLAAANAAAALRCDESEDDVHPAAEPLPGLVIDLAACGLVDHEAGHDAVAVSADPGRRLARAVLHAVCAARARAGAPAPGCRDAAPAARRARAAGAVVARSLFADGTAHAVLTPAAPGVAPTLAAAAHAGPAALAAVDGLLAPATLGGLPTVVVKAWECRETGLPAGVALSAGPGRDAVALAAGVVVDAAVAG